jgi:hypothetical protein
MVSSVLAASISFISRTCQEYLAANISSSTIAVNNFNLYLEPEGAVAGKAEWKGRERSYVAINSDPTAYLSRNTLRKAYVARVGEDGAFCGSGEIGTSSRPRA